MKRLLCLTLIVSMLVLVACSSSNSDKSGDFSKERDVTTEDIALFKETMKDEANNLTPLKVSTQVVSGTNYKFYVQVNDQKNTFEYITIYVSLDAKEAPKVTERKTAK